jgi:predicted DCC family thiol-disulfide oxidoreductase YuxK
MPDAKDPHPIVLFDGVCNLCNASVDFLIRHDPHARLRFASLQSDLARRLLPAHGLDPGVLSSIVLLDGGRAYTRSAAALRIARRLRLLSPLAYLGAVLPPPLRDGLYDAIAIHRYRWFGKRDTCRLPTPEERSRFLD